MATRKIIEGRSLHCLSVDEIIGEAVEREKGLMEFYRRALVEVVADARLVMKDLCDQNGVRIGRLESLKQEIADLRELASPIAD